jgi:hypothetical protein
MIDRYGLRCLEQAAEAFFQSDSALLHRHGYGLAAFLEVLPILFVLRPRAAPASRLDFPAIVDTQRRDTNRSGSHGN